MKFDTRDPKNQRKMTYITVILVIVVGMASSLLRGGQEDSEYLTFHNEGYLTVQDESGETADVYYTQMISIQLLEDPDYGQSCGGSVADNMRLGQWSSQQLGLYWNCTDTGLGVCVFITAENGAFAISYESDATTEALYQAVLAARDTLTARETESS